METPMRTISIEKITLNVGTGKEKVNVERGLRLLKMITGKKPIATLTQRRIPSWGLRPGLPVGCKVTLRKQDATLLLPSLLDAVNFTLSEKNFDGLGNLSFGIHEYIDIKGVKYDPDIGMMGLEVSVTLKRPGFRVKRRRIKPAKPSPSHQITKSEAIHFFKTTYKVKIIEEEEN
ncbi:MAG: 50S ribosomal protein L5 [Candidatus Woesearchaeota archaeon]